MAVFFVNIISDSAMNESLVERFLQYQNLCFILQGKSYLNLVD